MNMNTWLATFVFAFSSFCFAACADEQPGIINGTVVNEKGQPVGAATVSIDPLDGGPRSAPVREVQTESNGRFSMDDLKFGTYKLFAMKESAGYPNTAFAFYSNNIFSTATLTPTTPVIDVVLKVGPPAGVFTGYVTDAVTHQPVRAAFLLRRVADPGNWISLSQQPHFRVLLPALTPISVEVFAPGYRTYYYAGAADALNRPPLKLDSGEEKKNDFQLEPEGSKKSGPTERSSRCSGCGH